MAVTRDSKYLVDSFRSDPKVLKSLEVHSGSLYADLLQQDDEIILKFLTDRGGNVKKAVKLFCAMLEWRAEVSADNAFTWSFNVDAIRKSYQQRFCGFTKDGYPIYVERLGKLQINNLVLDTTIDDYTRYHILHWEFVHRVLFDLASDLAGRRIEKLVTIVDLTGLNAGVINTTTLEVLRRIAEIDQQYYPESAHKLYIINVPWIFKAAWAFLRPLINARARGKIEILSGDCTELLNSILPHEYVQAVSDGDLGWDTLTPEDKLWNLACSDEVTSAESVLSKVSTS